MQPDDVVLLFSVSALKNDGLGLSPLGKGSFQLPGPLCGAPTFRLLQDADRSQVLAPASTFEMKTFLLQMFQFFCVRFLKVLQLPNAVVCVGEAVCYFGLLCGGLGERSS